MKTARELMTAKPFVIQSGQEIQDVVKFFVDSQITSAPVVTPNGEILGVLTEMALIRASLRNYIQKSHEKVIYYKELFVEATAVKETTPLADVLKQLLKAPSHRLIVVNNANAIMGIISPKDVIVFMYGEEKEFVSLKQRLKETKAEVDKLKHKLEDTQKILNHYETMFKDSPMMMHATDEKGRIVMANKRIHDILGYEAGELVGKSILDLYAKSCHPEALAGLQSIIEKGDHHNVYSTMVKKNGEKMRVDLVSTALFDRMGKFVSTITASRAIDSEVLLRALHGAFKSNAIEEKQLNELIKQLNDDDAA